MFSRGSRNCSFSDIEQHTCKNRHWFILGLEYIYFNLVQTQFPEIIPLIAIEVPPGYTKDTPTGRFHTQAEPKDGKIDDTNERLDYWESATVRMDNFLNNLFRRIPDVTNLPMKNMNNIIIYVPDTNLKPPNT